MPIAPRREVSPCVVHRAVSAIAHFHFRSRSRRWKRFPVRRNCAAAVFCHRRADVRQSCPLMAAGASNTSRDCSFPSGRHCSPHPFLRYNLKKFMVLYLRWVWRERWKKWLSKGNKDKGPCVKKIFTFCIFYLLWMWSHRTKLGNKQVLKWFQNKLFLLG